MTPNPDAAWSWSDVLLGAGEAEPKSRSRQPTVGIAGSTRLPLSLHAIACKRQVRTWLDVTAYLQSSGVPYAQDTMCIRVNSPGLQSLATHRSSFRDLMARYFCSMWLKSAFLTRLVCYTRCLANSTDPVLTWHLPIWTPDSCPLQCTCTLSLRSQARLMSLPLPAFQRAHLSKDPSIGILL